VKTFVCVVVVSLLLASTAQGADLPLRNARADVVGKYQTLRLLEKQELRAAWAPLSPEMRADIWTMHIVELLNEHPELTPGQRSLVYEGLGLIASGIFNVDRQNPDAVAAARQTVRQYSERVFAQIPPEIAGSVMYELRDVRTPTFSDRINRFRPRAQATCNCSGDWSYYDCGDFYFCDTGEATCIFYYACGPWMFDTCNGMCE
jgi:hypothetical protein